MKTLKALIFSTLLISALCGCANSSKVSKNTAAAAAFPTDEESRSILGMENALIFHRHEAAGPTVYAFLPSKDSSGVRVATLNLVKKIWTKSSDAFYTTGGDFPLSWFGNQADTVLSDAKRYMTFERILKKDDKIIKSVFCYLPQTYSLQYVSFYGRLFRDGKYHGYDTLDQLLRQDEPSTVWSINVLRKDSTLVFFSKERKLSETAIEMWNEKNQDGKSGKITFGILPEECSLVGQFKKAQKESGKSYKVAIVDTEENTLLVAQSKSKGNYLLLWSEPLCRNSKTDQLLNSIYFDKSGRLILCYYKGAKTYKRSLSLVSGELR